MRLPRRRALSALLSVGLVVGIGAAARPAAALSALPPLNSVFTGNDASWPNCPLGMGTAARPTEGKPMPDAGAGFAILGVTNGPGFTTNPCLRAQVLSLQARHLWTGAYAVASYPSRSQFVAYGGTTGTMNQRLYRVGATQANSSIRAMRAAGLRTPMLWVDVETVGGFPWSATTSSNNAFLNGVMAAYRGAGLRVGIYTYRGAWRAITGSRYLPVPTWVPSGLSTRASALAKCTGSPTGGAVWMGQWVANQRDYDVTCPGVTGSGTSTSLIPRMFAPN